MRQKRPVLYELLREQNERESAPASPPNRVTPYFEEDGADSKWLSPGRAVRIPLGYVFLGIAAILLLGGIAYTIGMTRGDDTARDREQAQQIVDDEQARIAAAQAEAARRDGASQSRPAPRTPPRTDPSGRRVAGAIESDPRQSGLNYFFIVHTRRETAIRVAQFCRENQLEAYVVGDNNSGSRGVCVVPGFEWSDRASPEIRTLEQQVLRVIQKWNMHVGKDDLSTFVVKKYTG